MKPREDCRILAVGDLVTDLNMIVDAFPIFPEAHQVVDNLQFEPGGAGNFLIAGSHLGATMVALGVVGNDLFGTEMISTFQLEGIDTRGIVQQEDGSTTIVFGLADGKGQHVFLGHIGTGPDVDLTDHWRDAIHHADAVHCFGYTLQEERLTDALLESMAYARLLKKPVFFDPGPHVKNVPWELRQAALDRCSAVFLTEDEIPFVLENGRCLQDAEDLLTEDVGLVVVKLGKSGCVAFTHEGEVAHPGFVVEEVDSTAAGDSFAAALIIALIQGYPLEGALAVANAMGAAKVRKLGSGRQVPTLMELRDVLAGEVDF